MLHVIWSSTLSPSPSWSSSGYSGRQAGPCRSARSTSELAAPIVTSGVKQAYQTWGWAASIGKSLRRSGSSPRRSSTRLGTRVRPWAHSSFRSRAERPQSPRPYSTSRRKPEMRSSRVAWKRVWLRVTTALECCWRNFRLKGWRKERAGHERGNHERNATSATYWPKHWRSARGLPVCHHSLYRPCLAAARNWRFPAARPADERRALSACYGLSHSLRRRGQLHHGPALTRQARVTNT